MPYRETVPLSKRQVPRREIRGNNIDFLRSLSIGRELVSELEQGKGVDLDKVFACVSKACNATSLTQVLESASLLRRIIALVLASGNADASEQTIDVILLNHHRAPLALAQADARHSNTTVRRGELAPYLLYPPGQPVPLRVLERYVYLDRPHLIC